MDRRDWLWLSGCIIACELAGVAGAAFTAGSASSWYPLLARPWFTPPAWVFGPAWAALYALMGLSLFLVARPGRKPPAPALLAFVIQLSLNVLWSAIFFGLRMPLAALIELGFLWISIAATMALFARVERRAALLLAPYLACVSFAGLLNYYIVALN